MNSLDLKPQTLYEDRRYQSAKHLSDITRSSWREPFGSTVYFSPLVSPERALQRTGHAIVTSVSYGEHQAELNVLTRHLKTQGPVDPPRVEDILYENGFPHQDESRSNAERALLAYTSMPIAVVSGMTHARATYATEILSGVFPSERMDASRGPGGFTDLIKQKIDLRYRQLCAYLEEHGLGWGEKIS